KLTFIPHKILRKSKSMTTVAAEFPESFYASLTLSERLSCLWQRDASRPANAVDSGRAADALRRWKSQRPFTIGDYFENRLRIEGLTEEELLKIICMPVAEFSGLLQTPPQWLQDLARLYAAGSEPLEGNPRFH